jgi:hypothetical protein
MSEYQYYEFRAVDRPLRKEELAGFLRVDEDLIEVAAEGSADLEVAWPAHEALERWIGSLAESEKNSLLLRLLREGDGMLHAELLQRFRQETAPDRRLPQRAVPSGNS